MTKTGNKDKEPMWGTKTRNTSGKPKLRTNDENGEQRMRKDKDGEKRVKKFYPVTTFEQKVKKFTLLPSTVYQVSETL